MIKAICTQFGLDKISSGKLEKNVTSKNKRKVVEKNNLSVCHRTNQANAVIIK